MKDAELYSGIVDPKKQVERGAWLDRNMAPKWGRYRASAERWRPCFQRKEMP